MTSVSRFSDLLAALTLWNLVFLAIWRQIIDSELQNFKQGLVLYSGGFGISCFVWNIWIF